MKMLIACEYSGIVRDAFIAKGHDAISCDMLPTERPGPHYQGKVEDILYDHWDMIIAFPPCTYLCNSGVQYLHTEPSRREKLKQGCNFFNLFLKHYCGKICIENPIPHRYAMARFYKQKKYTQTVQQWWFGDDASKRTCLWLKNLPKLKPTKIIVKHRYANQTPQGSNKIGPSEDRAKLRSQIFPGLANAMAELWG